MEHCKWSWWNWCWILGNSPTFAVTPTPTPTTALDIGCGPGIAINATTFCCPGQSRNAILLDFTANHSSKKSIGKDTIPSSEHDQEPSIEREKKQQSNVGYSFYTCDGNYIGFLPSDVTYNNSICAPNNGNFKVIATANPPLFSAFNGFKVLHSNNNSLISFFYGYNLTLETSSGPCLNCSNLGNFVTSYMYLDTAQGDTVIMKNCDGTIFQEFPDSYSNNAVSFCVPNQFSVSSSKSQSYWAFYNYTGGFLQSAIYNSSTGGQSSSTC